MSYRRGNVDHVWPSGLLPIVLSSAEASELSRIGASVARLLKPSWQFLRSRADIRRQLFSSAKAEGEFWIDDDHDYPVPSRPLFRLDLLATGDGMVLLDVNLMPGMAGITHVHAELFASSAVAPVEFSGARPYPFDINAWIEGTITQFSSGGRELDYVIRRHHALVPDIEILATECRSQSVDAEVHFLDSYPPRHERRRPVVRQVRETTKHRSVDPTITAAESAGFAQLIRLIKSKEVDVAPGLYMYLESHAWMSIWQSPEFREYADVIVGPEALAGLRLALPRTDFAATGGDKAQHYRDDELLESVLKRADSTGGDGFFDPRAYLPAEALARMRQAIELNKSGELLLQAIVDSPSIRMPYIALDGQVRTTTSSPKVAAYFVGEELTGVHALVPRGPAPRAGWPSEIDLPLLVAVVLDDK